MLVSTALVGLEKFLTEHVSWICATALFVAGTSKFNKRGGLLRNLENVMEDAVGAKEEGFWGDGGSGSVLVAGMS